MQPVMHKEKDMPIQEACDILSSGGVLLYPTDTLYALGADPLQKNAMQKLFSLKQRSGDKRVSYIFSDFEQMEQYAYLTPAAESLKKFLPGKITIILKGKRGEEGTIGVRVPDNAFCLALAAAYGPVTTTSANISGEEDLYTVDSILKKIPDINMVVDGGGLYGPASTVVDVRNDTLRVLRQGVVFVR